MSWYNTYSDSNKKLDLLIDSQPTLQQLLEYPDFLDLLKAYQPRLLEYITNSIEIPREILRYITQPPGESDSESRKYKLPLLTMLMVETNTTCVINSFFKIDPKTQRTFFINAFLDFLGREGELLPLLCGYFSQLNLILWNNRYKETIDLVYQAQLPLGMLAKHCYSKAIVNTLLLYLNLDLTRNSNSPPERVVLKLQVIRQLFDQMRECFQRSKKGLEGGHDTIVENIGQVLVEIIEKYYLIADGKAMLEIITSQENVGLVVEIFMQGGPMALAAANIVGWLMRYYCLSSFNTEDPQNQQLNKRNQERLQSQPFPKLVIELIPKVAQTLANANPFTLYHSKLLQIFNMSLELTSKRIVQTIKRVKYIELVISLLFKFPTLSIVHKMVQKLFFLIFNSEKSACEQYRKYLFCQAGLIELTIGAYLARIPDLPLFRQNINTAHEGFFAYLMRIIKIYSKIQTNDEEINKSIVARSGIWEQFSAFIMQPFEALCFKDLGSYENLPQRIPVEYTIKCLAAGLNNNQQVSKKVLEEINQEESMQKFKAQQPDKPQQQIKTGGLSEDTLFNVQQFNGPQGEIKKTQFQTNISMPQNVAPDSFEHHLAPSPGIQIQIPAPKTVITHIAPPQQIAQQEPTKKEADPAVKKYEEFLNSKKQQVDKELKMQRTNSSQKRLSANKSRVTSPSPKKKRWDDNNSQEEEKPAPKLTPAPAPAPKLAENEKKQKISLTTPNMRPPMIPHAKPPPVITIIPTGKEPKLQPKKTESAKDPSPRLQESLANADTVNTSVTSLPDIKLSQPSISIPRQQDKSLLDQRSPSAGQLANSQLVQRNILEQSRRLSKSAINLSDLKNVQFRRERALKPEKSEYRKVEAKDKVLLDFLGVKY